MFEDVVEGFFYTNLIWILFLKRLFIDCHDHSRKIFLWLLQSRLTRNLHKHSLWLSQFSSKDFLFPQIFSFFPTTCWIFIHETKQKPACMCFPEFSSRIRSRISNISRERQTRMWDKIVLIFHLQLSFGLQSDKLEFGKWGK